MNRQLLIMIANVFGFSPDRLPALVKRISFSARQCERCVKQTVRVQGKAKSGRGDDGLVIIGDFVFRGPVFIQGEPQLHFSKAAGLGLLSW